MSEPSFQIDRIQPNHLRLVGVLRLPHQEAYDRALGTLEEGARSAEGLIFDVRGVVYMNSSGIRWLAMRVLDAKRHGRPIRIVGDPEVVWQAKSLHGLEALYDGLTVALSSTR